MPHNLWDLSSPTWAQGSESTEFETLGHQKAPHRGVSEAWACPGHVSPAAKPWSILSTGTPGAELAASWGGLVQIWGSRSPLWMRPGLTLPTTSFPGTLRAVSTVPSQLEAPLPVLVRSRGFQGQRETPFWCLPWHAVHKGLRSPRTQTQESGGHPDIKIT